jgi:NAD(P)-dependent dehydrogenase (short-subunit alcohol dehydrogenase family)
MNNIFDLSGKVALITGSAGLLGPKHAEALLDFGCTVILTDINESLLKERFDMLSLKYEDKNVYMEIMDVTDKNSIDSVVRKYEKIDILINNAAKDPKVTKGDGNLTPETRFEIMSKEYFEDGIDAIINGTFLTTQSVCNKMLKTGGGVVLNISSDLGVIAPDQRIYRDDSKKEEEQNVKPITYSAAKWAVIGMTKYLAIYFAKNNIRVNCLSPTGVYNDHPIDFVERLSNIIPMGRMANIDEYKGAIVFMCSNASSYMTGTNLIIDGGKTVW